MAYTTADRSDLLRDTIFRNLCARHLRCVQRVLNFGLLADRGLLAGVTADRGLLAGEAHSRSLHGKLVGCIKDTNRLILKTAQWNTGNAFHAWHAWNAQVRARHDSLAMDSWLDRARPHVWLKRNGK